MAAEANELMGQLAKVEAENARLRDRNAYAAELIRGAVVNPKLPAAYARHWPDRAREWLLDYDSKRRAALASAEEGETCE